MSTGSEGSLKFADEEKGVTGHTNATSPKVQIVAADDGVKRDGGILGKSYTSRIERVLPPNDSAFLPDPRATAAICGLGSQFGYFCHADA
ncbi:BQ5605_C007g04481 [Microbotryum silenes-dioicae]|uniref:BQ5605_C007g04481 protein n=1 Tax=Microbotryum silenes-dioicae TaxID=796604 RepID=A0A2X0N1A8_9BASI|nr:BQ5605_C007g04481 [Microbotryum silenes-dioicae]